MNYLCHELRNPLHVIIGTIDIIWEILKQDNTDDEKIKKLFINDKEGINRIHSIHDPKQDILNNNRDKYENDLKNIRNLSDELNIIKINAFNMLTTANDVLDLDKFSKGNLVINLKTIDIPSLIRDTINQFVNMLHKDVKIHIYVSKKLPNFINSDKGRIQQILYNGLSNAGKYSLDPNIFLRINYLKKSKLILFEIINESKKILFDIDKIFIPINKKLIVNPAEFKQNVKEKIIYDYNEIESYFEFDKSKGYQYYVINSKSNNQFQIESYGLGLPISRIITILLKGNIGFHEFKKDGKNYVRFWFVIPYIKSKNIIHHLNKNTSENTSENSFEKNTLKKSISKEKDKEDIKEDESFEIKIE